MFGWRGRDELMGYLPFTEAHGLPVWAEKKVDHVEASGGGFDPFRRPGGGLQSPESKIRLGLCVVNAVWNQMPLYVASVEGEPSPGEGACEPGWRARSASDQCSSSCRPFGDRP